MENANLWLWEQVREVPNEAKKTITGGKLTGFTDISPVWRMKKLTEVFGVAGIGWKAPVVKFWTEQGAGGEVAAFCLIELYYKKDDKWSDPTPGIGGSMLVNTEKGKLVTNDEAFKMAYTDAISVAAKALGVGADVYFGADRTKYDGQSNNGKSAQNGKRSNNNQYGTSKGKLTQKQISRAFAIAKEAGQDMNSVNKWLKSIYGIDNIANATKEQYDSLCARLEAVIKERQARNNQEDNIIVLDEERERFNSLVFSEKDIPYFGDENV